MKWLFMYVQFANAELMNNTLSLHNKIQYILNIRLCIPLSLHY